MKGELFINGFDAYDKWGVSLSEGAFTALLAPPSLKDYIVNECRSQHGKTMISTGKIASRSLSLEVHMTAKTQEEFFERYVNFCEELKKGRLDITTKYQPNIVYKTYYISCTQFKQYMLGLAKFTLKLEESNPEDRTFN